MSHLHMIRNHRPEMSMIKQIVQYALFLIVCGWLLYQIHHSVYVRRDLDCDFIENRLTEERIAKVLGRKGGVGKSHYTEEVELYGVDLIGEAVRINNVTDFGDNQSDDLNSKGNGVVEWDDQGEQTDEVDLVQVEDKKVNASMREVSQESEIDSVVKVNAVILKRGEKLGSLKFSDENGVPEHDSGPSKRSDVEVKSVRKGDISKTKNQTQEMKGCQNVDSQNVTEKRYSKLEKRVVEKEMPKMVTVESEKGSMRDLLLSEM